VTEPRWLSVEEVARLHDIQIQRYGGQPGVRDRGLLESAVLRPRNKHHYEGATDLVELAASYAAAISGNHPFFDGNKRTAFFTMAVFLEINGLQLKAPESEATRAMLELAADSSSEGRFRDWLRAWVV
jgi:death on curing protein